MSDTDFATLYGDYAGLASIATRRRRERSTALENARFYGQMRGQRALEDLTRGFQEKFQPLQTSYARRGLGSSGVRQRALRDYASNYQRQMDAQMMANAREQAELNEQDTAAQSELDQYLEDLKLRKQRDIMGTANILSSLGSYGG